MSKKDYPKIAREIAEKFAARMPKAYESSVAKYLKHYDEPPDEDDFWGWLEGYDWADSDAGERDHG